MKIKYLALVSIEDGFCV